MAKIQCKMCGGMNEVKEGATSWECPYCGMLTTFPKLDTEHREQLYNRAERFRQANNFDKAVAAYESILDLDNEDPEAYWGLLISKYGIEYVEDPAMHERIPTCHRVQFESILADPDYLNALKYAVGYDKDIYEKEAKRISEIQKDILRISAQEKPYDVFICYKETTDGGSRTKDSILAQDMYDHLAAQGLKVFFARITLEDKLGQQYEPYIFAALNSAKVMLVVGSKKEYFEAVWVKNEWSRFLALKKKDRSKLLIPCFVDMDAYDIPEELQIFQSQDMNKIGFMQDLVRGIKKVAGVGQAEAKPGASSGGNAEIAKVKKRVAILLDQQEWDKAKEVCDAGLNLDPENSDLYLMLCMIVRRVPNEEALRRGAQNLAVDKNFQTALKLASPERKRQLESIQQDAVVGFFLKKCVDSSGVRNVEQLPQSNVILGQNEAFLLAMQNASPERRKDLEGLLAQQCECLLGKCLAANRVPDEAALAQCETPLASDPFFAGALSCALPERRQELQKIQEAQVEYFVRTCMAMNNVSSEEDLSRCEAPLGENMYFAMALQCATPERRAQLQRLQSPQSDLFLQRCMETNHVSDVNALPQCETPLASDPFFVCAVSCAAPERRRELQNIQLAQVDFFLRKCMAENHVSSAAELPASEFPLNKNLYFLKALQYSTPEHQAQLNQLQCAQSDHYLRKCMQKRSVTDISKLHRNLVRLVSLDKDFKMAMLCASPEQLKVLEKVVAKEKALSNLVTAIVIFGAIGILVILYQMGVFDPK